MHTKASAAATPPDTFIRAADLSFTPQIKQSGWVFYDSTGTALDILTVFKNNGCNTIRLRLWYSPATVHSSLPEVAAFAAQIKAAGMKIWLDIHYSDTWADQGNQAKPAAWQSLNNTQLLDSVYAYTQRVTSIIKPDYIQIGNEINNGFLYPTGEISNSTANFLTLLRKGIKAVRDYNPSIKIIIHYAGYAYSENFYSTLRTNSIDYDIIGLSYYPIYHGRILDSLSANMTRLSAQNNKPIVIAETAYPFTLSWNDYTNNTIGDTAQIIPAYPPTLAGQKAYMYKLRSIIQAIPLGKGFDYWAPDWVAYNGPTATNGSPAENEALFDFKTKAVPAMDVYHK